MFILLQRLVPQHLFSRLVGHLANSQNLYVKTLFIQFAIRCFNIDLSEAAEENPQSYRCFNDFFTRALKADARPIESHFCAPADGTLSANGAIQQGQLIQAKGLRYSLEKLLASDATRAYQAGSFTTIYLAPNDYHRVHSPADLTLTAARYIPGRLFSVNQSTTASVSNLFTMNERLVMEFDSQAGKLAVIMVGAMLVAAIQPVWRDAPYQACLPMVEDVAEKSPSPLHFKAGAELGRFQMGSTVILLTEQVTQWRHSPGSPIKMGQTLSL